MSNATKRIPVTEERWAQLSELKEPGQTYDELLDALIREHRRQQLADQVTAVREADGEELTRIDDV